MLGKGIEREYALADLLCRPNVSYEKLITLTDVDGRNLGGPGETESDVREQVEIQIKYAGYIERQAKEIERQRNFENMRLPDDLDYAEVSALSIEVRQKLAQQRPETLGQASRISGITPAAISLLLVYLKKRNWVGLMPEENT